MKIARFILCGTVLLTFAHFSFAQVFRCDAGNGKVTYSDQLCPDGSKEKLVGQKRTAREIYEDEMRANLANQQKYRAQAMEQSEALMRQQQVMARPVQPVAPPPLSASRECKEAQKDYDFAASIRTGSDTDRRLRTNAAISKVNASCGSNTPLQQEPTKVIIHNKAPAGGAMRCDNNWCTDSYGNTSPRMR
jgi:hypothetical protein